MAKNDNLTDFLTDVANAIRTKKGTTALINPQDFSSEIASIQTGGGNSIIELIEREITTFTIPQGTTKLGAGAFYRCEKLVNIIIPNSVTSIGAAAFVGCIGLTSITIPNSVTSIGNEAFSMCSKLTSITIPDSVTSIGNLAFYNCSKLTSITIPNSVTIIGSNAFNGCSKLTTIKLLPTTPPKLGNTNSIPSNVTTIEVPADSLEAYQTATNWSNFADKMVGV